MITDDVLDMFELNPEEKAWARLHQQLPTVHDLQKDFFELAVLPIIKHFMDAEMPDLTP